MADPQKLTKVHLISKPSSMAHQILTERLDTGINLTYGLEIPSPADYQVLVSGRPEAEFLAASSHLEVLIIPWAGLPTATRDLMLDHPGIAVHNLHHNAAATAEMALGLLFAVAKHLLPMDRSLRAHDWRPRYQRETSLLLQSKTALILGYGAIGTHVGHVLHTLGLRVLAVKRNPKVSCDDYAEIYTLSNLPDLLPQTEVLIVTLPLTPQTEGLLGAAEISLLPPGAVLINVGRGPIVDQAALYKALKERHLRGAGLDVWYNYPPDQESRENTPPADFPFQELETVVMSPHRGGAVDEIEQLRMIALGDSLNAAARGEIIPSRVDLQAGY